MKKYIVLAVFTIGILVSPAFTQAAGLSTAQIQAILSLLSSFGVDSATIANVQTALSGGTPSTGGQSFCHNFDTDLTIGDAGDSVNALQVALSREDSSFDFGKDVFTEDTAAEVVKFQAKYGIRQTGYVGPLTRAKLNALYRCRTDESSPQPTKPTPKPSPIPTCEAIATPACIGEPIVGVGGCTVGWKCKTGTVPTPVVSEQVKCVFNGATTEQKCWGDVPASTVGTPVERYSCSGVGTCVVTVKGQSGKPMTWGSSCGGSANTTIGGDNEYANFSCASVPIATAAPVLELWVSPSAITPGQSATISWSSGNTNKCTAYENNSPAAANPELVKTIGSFTQTFSESKTYTFTCGGPGGYVTKSVTVTVNNFVSEQVKCVFNNATIEQKCWGDASTFATTGEREPQHYGCSGVGTCVVSVSAPKNTPVTWGSSCGGSTDTVIDGDSKYAYFSCGESIQSMPIVTIDTGFPGTLPITYKNLRPGTNVRIIGVNLPWFYLPVTFSNVYAITGSAYTNNGIASVTLSGSGQSSIPLPSTFAAGSYVLELSDPSNGWTIYLRSSPFQIAPVLPAATPTTPALALIANPSTITAGQSATLSWKIADANRCILQYGSKEENIPPSGSSSLTVYPSQTTSYRIWCANDPGTGKDGPSAEKTVTINVTSTPSNDDRRISDLKIIYEALKKYEVQKGFLPTTGMYQGNDGTGWDYSSQGKFMTFLSDAGIIPSVPVDPVNDGFNDVLTPSKNGYAYGYYCYASTGSISLGARLENPSKYPELASKIYGLDVYWFALEEPGHKCSDGSTLGRNIVHSETQVAGVANALPQNIESNVPTVFPRYIHLFSDDLYRGVVGEEVKALQEVLKTEGLFVAEVTGNFYDHTVEAVKSFQEKYGINATGYVGPATRTKLNELYGK